MAQSEAEKKAKAHEYYMEYTKKKKKKGRKKGKAKTKAKKAKKISLVGLSTGGLNEQGAMQWAMAKEKLTNEMNSALGKAKTQEEKDKIRQEYQQKALSELQKMKSDPSMAKAKATKSSKSSSGSKSSKNSSKSSSKSGSSTEKSTNTASKQATEQMTEAVGQMADLVTQLTQKLLGNSAEGIESQLANLTDEQKVLIRTNIQSTIDAIKKKLGIK